MMKYIEYIATGALFIAAWIAKRPKLQRIAINWIGKWLMRKLLKITKDRRATFLNEDTEVKLCKQAIKELMQFSGTMAELGFDIKPKKMESPDRKRVDIRGDKKLIKQTFTKGQKKMKARDKETLKRLRNSVKKLSILIAVAIIGCLWCGDAPAVELIDPEAITSDFVFFPRAPRIGILWDIKDWQEHSQISASIVGWRNLLFIDVGLVDFEQIETEGDQWYQTLNISVGITLDIMETLERWPAIEPYLIKIPDFVYISGGIYVRPEDSWSTHAFLSAGLTW